MPKQLNKVVAAIVVVLAIAGCSNPPPEAPRQKTIQEKLGSTSAEEKIEGAEDAINKYGKGESVATE
jgi:hypothetical protein